MDELLEAYEVLHRRVEWTRGDGSAMQLSGAYLEGFQVMRRYGTAAWTQDHICSDHESAALLLKALTAALKEKTP